MNVPFEICFGIIHTLGEAVKKSGLATSKWEFGLELFDSGEMPVPDFSHN